MRNDKKTIPVNEPLMSGNELRYVSECIRTSWISSAGNFLERFESEWALYCGQKHGIGVSSGTAALELASRNITVNAVAPGFIETDMTASLTDKAKNAMLDRVPLKRSGKPEDVAAVVGFLASENAAYITGQVIHVSGGMYL